MPEEGRAAERQAVSWFGRAAASVAFAMIGATPALAQDSYAGKQINLIIGEAPGGGYDSYGRLLARHIARHIPGTPTVVAQNMPGAGSLNAMNYIFNVAPKDGSVFGTVQRSVIIMPLLGMAGANFAPDQLTYLGSMDQDVGVCIVRRGAGIDTIEDTRTHEMVVGTEGRVSDVNSFVNPLVRILGLKLRIVSGYSGAQPINLAIERGEIDGRCGMSYSSLKRTTSFLRDNKVTILIQLAIAKDPELPDVPLFTDLAPNEQDRGALELLLAPTAIARPFFLPPGVPAARAEILRNAFAATMTDPDYLGDAARENISARAYSGAEMQALVERIYRLPPAVVARAKALVDD
jgi:tripartite-type tricarboxylate transporter receptor subunit TctC